MLDMNENAVKACIVIGIVIVSMGLLAFILIMYNLKRKYDIVEQYSKYKQETYKQTKQDYKNTLNDLGIREYEFWKTAKILLKTIKIFKH